MRKTGWSSCLLLSLILLGTNLTCVQCCAYYLDLSLTSWLYCPELMNHSTAKDYCESRGYHLASIQNAADYALLRIVLGFFVQIANVNYPVWLGYYLDPSSNTYYWTSNYNAIDFSQFDSIGDYSVVKPSRSFSVFNGFINVTLSYTTILLVQISQMNIIFNSNNSTSSQFSLVCNNRPVITTTTSPPTTTTKILTQTTTLTSKTSTSAIAGVTTSTLKPSTISSVASSAISLTNTGTAITSTTSISTIFTNQIQSSTSQPIVNTITTTMTPKTTSTTTFDSLTTPTLQPSAITSSISFTNTGTTITSTILVSNTVTTPAPSSTGQPTDATLTTTSNTTSDLFSSTKTNSGSTSLSHISITKMLTSTDISTSVSYSVSSTELTTSTLTNLVTSSSRYITTSFEESTNSRVSSFSYSSAQAVSSKTSQVPTETDTTVKTSTQVGTLLTITSAISTLEITGTLSSTLRVTSVSDTTGVSSTGFSSVSAISETTSLITTTTVPLNSSSCYSCDEYEECTYARYRYDNNLNQSVLYDSFYFEFDCYTIVEDASNYSKIEASLELEEISNRTASEVIKIHNKYNKQIFASMAFGYIAIAFMIGLPGTIILNDLSKVYKIKLIQQRLKQMRESHSSQNRLKLKPEKKHGKELCESINKSRRQISEFDRFFLKTLVNMDREVKRRKFYY